MWLLWVLVLGLRLAVGVCVVKGGLVIVVFTAACGWFTVVLFCVLVAALLLGLF